LSDNIPDENEQVDQTDPGNSENPEIPEDPGDPGDDELIPNSQEIYYENAITIAFSGNNVVIDNPFSENGVTVEEDNGHVVIRSTITDSELNYILSGITSDGSVKIYGEKKFGLILNGVGITNPNGAAINIQNKKKALVTIVDQTNNRLIDGAVYTYTDGEDMKATFFSEGNLDISGKGSLEIRGKNKHGLCTDGALTFTDGVIHIKEAASDGIHANDEIILSGGTLTIRSVSDGIESESKTEAIEITGGTLNIVTTGEKGHAIKAKYNIYIDTGGSVDITVYGDASKGIKPTGDLTIMRGNITINTAGNAIWEEDEQDLSSAAGIKCDGNLLIESGTLYILSAGSGGKGINVDGTITVNDGDITVITTGNQHVYNRNNDTAAKAIKSDGDLTVNGGTIKIRTSKTEAEGLESKATLTITNGDIDIEAYDDAVNASKNIQIDGGKIYCKSETNDAIDSNGTIFITGGVVIAVGASSPEGGFDCDNNRFSITGGTILGIGGSTSSPTASASAQRSVIFQASANVQVIHIKNTSGSAGVLTFKLPVIYRSSSTVLFSSPLLEGSTGYTIYTGGSISDGSSFHGLYTDATYSGGSSSGTFTTGSAAGAVTSIGSSSGPGGGRP
jgi:hypothetical protein